MHVQISLFSFLNYNNNIRTTQKKTQNIFMKYLDRYNILNIFMTPFGRLLDVWLLKKQLVSCNKFSLTNQIVK